MEGNEMYSVEFDKGASEYPKVITYGRTCPTAVCSQICGFWPFYCTQFRLVKANVDEEDAVYQIMSTDGKLVLAMKENESQVYLEKPNKSDKRQHWEFVDVETNEIVVYPNPHKLQTVQTQRSGPSEQQSTATDLISVLKYFGFMALSSLRQ